MKNYTITVNGIAYEVTVEEGTGSSTKAAAPVVMPVAAPVAPKTVAPTPVAKEEPKAEEAAPKAAAPSGSAGSVKVNAPMPGKILAIKASIGQSMKRGDVLLILEAMKMENEIVAPEDGILASINVTVGDMVEAGVLLATMNK
ncbi:MAG: Biotin carboxyl carrier protein [Anaerocolumna sp.]|jgi:glutaconyl-CoA decarboxylase|nr:Biotin carboxyl carrier protein [Anaerocolumna sp.]